MKPTEEKNTYFKELWLINYRTHKNLKLTFNRNITVISGGAGKTAIISALSTILGRINYRSLDVPGITPNDIHLHHGEMFAGALIEINQEDFLYAGTLPKKHEILIKPCKAISSYNFHRFFDTKKKNYLGKIKTIPYLTLMIKQWCAGIGHMGITDFKNSLSNLIINQPNYPEIVELNAAMFKAVQHTLNRLIQWELGVDVYQNVYLQRNQNLPKTPIRLISSGESKILWLAWNLVKINDEDFDNLKGIVLMDDLDSNLSSTTLKNLIINITQFFPNIQFIVTMQDIGIKRSLILDDIQKDFTSIILPYNI